MSQAQATEKEKLEPETLRAKLEHWLRDVNEPDRVYTKNKKIEVVFLLEAVNAILPRTEGVEDITLFKIPGTEYEVPAILPEKLQAVSRRDMLSYLRSYRDKQNKENKELRTYLKKLSVVYKGSEGKGKEKKEILVGFKKAKDELWNCYIQPPSGEETDVGMDGFCPACALFGTVLDSSKIEGVGNISVGVKSRVEFDPAIAISDRKVSVIGLTHNKVSDGVSWTGQSLFTEQHVLPGTVFVGKVTLEDVTEPELKAFLAVLSAIDRLGGRESVFGGVRVHLVGVRGGSYETVSALELAKALVAEYGEKLPNVGTVAEKLKETLKGKGFIVNVNQENFRKIVDSNTWNDLWRSTLIYDKQVLERVLQLGREEKKYEEAEEWKKQ